MTYQAVLPFDEAYAWTNLIKQLKKLNIGQKISYYGFKGRKIILKRVSSQLLNITSYSLTALKSNIEYDNGLKFIEVEFMSTVLKPNTKHIHTYIKSRTKNANWKNQIYKCADPNCSHYQQAEFIIGKTVLCECGETTIASYEQIRHRNRKLTCLMCSKSPKKEAVKLVNDEMKDLFKEKEDLGIPYSNYVENIEKETK